MDGLMRERSFRKLLYTLAIIGLSLDLAGKYVAFRMLAPGSIEGHYDIAPGVFKFIAQFTTEPLETGTWREPLQAANGRFMPRVNHGALFGIGNTQTFTANQLFATISIVAALAILIWSTKEATARDGVLCTALGLILGGTLGNLFDRIVFHGVRDYLYFYWFEWPVFNIADCCLVVGAGLLLLQAVLPAKTPENKCEKEMHIASVGA